MVEKMGKYQFSMFCDSSNRLGTYTALTCPARLHLPVLEPDGPRGARRRPFRPAMKGINLHERGTSQAMHYKSTIWVSRNVAGSWLQGGWIKHSGCRPCIPGANRSNPLANHETAAIFKPLPSVSAELWRFDRALAASSRLLLLFAIVPFCQRTSPARQK